MKKVSMTLENLKQLDYGVVSEHFGMHLKRVCEDLESRPADETARKVQIQFVFKPEVHSGGGLESASVEVEVSSTVPRHRTKPYRMQVHPDGRMSFHPDLPEEPEGSTLLDNME